MKSILIVAPTPLELSVIDLQWPNDSQLDTLVTGVGPVKTAIELTKHLSNQSTSPELLILIGICGVYKGEDHIGVGDVVISKSETFGDMGKCSHDAIYDIVIDETPLALTLQAHPTESLPIIGHRLSELPPQKVDMATVMCTSATFERAEIVHKRTGAQCENMEGASFFMVANAFNIPFLEIRAVSNVVGDNRENWKIDRALRALRAYLERLIV